MSCDWCDCHDDGAFFRGHIEFIESVPNLYPNLRDRARL